MPISSIFVKYLCRISSQSLQTFQATAGSGFTCGVLMLVDC